MHCKRCYVSVCVLDDKIYAMGGHDGDRRLTSTEVYCPKTNQWTLLANMTVERSNADAAQIGGKIYIFGSLVLLTPTKTHNFLLTFYLQEVTIVLRSCEVYDVTENKWTSIPEMLSARSGLKCVAYKNQIFVIGGYNGESRMSSCESFSPCINCWSPVPDMNSPRSNFGVEIVDDAIFVLGGYDGRSVDNKVEYFRAEQSKWYEETHILL